MRLIVSCFSLATIFLTSCAYEGVIVQKQARPHPLYDSIGIDGVYSFLLRDSSGMLHRQLVSAEVFGSYSEGQYFNDQQAPAASGEFKATEPDSAARENQTARHPTHAPPQPGPFPTPRRVSAAPPPVETSQSFRASELQHSSRSMTATLRTEVRSDATPESDGMKPIASEGKAPAEDVAMSQPATKESAPKSHKVADSSKKKSKAADAKPEKPWRMTEPTVETTDDTQPASATAPENAGASTSSEAAAPRDPNDVVYTPPPPK